MSNIINVKTSNLISAPNNPFRVVLDTEMEMLIESISQSGVITPIIARTIDNGKYEIVSGHRRKYACEFLNIDTVPVVIRELNKNEAIVCLVDSNLQRENVLPSEKAFAYKMKLEALSSQGKRNDLTSCQLGTKLRSDELMAQSVNDSARQIQRYIRLTFLIPELLKLVDEGKISFTPAVELSYLSVEQQQVLFQEMEINDCTPSLSQACRMKKAAQNNELTKLFIADVMAEEKANQKEMFKVPMEKIRQYTPKVKEKDIQDFVLKACEYYQKYLLRQRERER